MPEPKPQPEPEPELIENLSWGEHIDLDVLNHSDSWACENTSCGKGNFSGTRLFDHVIAVQTAPWKHGDHSLAAICECPDCFEKFWFHIPQKIAETILHKKSQNP